MRWAIFAITLLSFIPTSSVSSVQTDAEFTRAATAAVDRIEREDGFSGVILLARGDQVLLRKANGFADREHMVRNTPDTKFPLESVTKQFTATAIMLLVQEGKLALDDPISKYYAGSPVAWRNVTIKHLLTHSSGIRGLLGPSASELRSGGCRRAVQIARRYLSVSGERFSWF